MIDFGMLQSFLHAEFRQYRSDARMLWRYRTTDVPGVIELAFWSGPGPRSLRPHFHDETQITIVLAGQRTFHVNRKKEIISAGQAIVIPAGCIHFSVPNLGCDAKCVNLYLCEGISFTMGSIIKNEPLFPADMPFLEELMHAIELMPWKSRPITAKIDHFDLRALLAASDMSISQIAAGFRLSREGFSRRVKRELDIAPHSFRMISRLNAARRLLRSGHTVSAVAVETGFSDQSHLTRLFREAFGTTPRRYQQG